MASRRIALLGAGVGPWVSIDRIPTPHLEVRGIRAATVIATLRDKGKPDVDIHFSADGIYPLKPAEQVRVSCEPRCKTAICSILSMVS